jgi:hypothetical protein
VKLHVLSRMVTSDHSTTSFHFITALIVGLSIVVVFFSYRINNSCLTIGLDGASWSTYLEYQREDRQSFAQVGADPVQGNFDAYFPVSHEYLFSEVVTRPFSHATTGKTVNYFVYYLLMLVAFGVLVRSINISWPMALFAANLFGVLGFPGLAHLNSQTYGPFNFNPHIAQSIALSMFTVAAFWRLNPRRINGPAGTVALLAIPSICLLIDILSMGAQVIFILPATAVYGAAYMALYRSAEIGQTVRLPAPELETYVPPVARS